MKVLLVVLCLVIMPVNCLALQNPIEHARNTMIDDMKTSTIEIKNEMTKSVKEFIMTVISLLLEVFTVIAIGWLFTFMVDKSTAKMVKLVVMVCGITGLIKAITKAFE